MSTLHGSISDKERLWNTVQQFISDRKISCGEAVYDIDKWDCHSLPFIHELCEIVGFYEYGENN